MRQSSVKTADIATAEKEGFFTGRYVINPFSGERMPIWVGNFVLMQYGTGALMAVPAHDQRDFDFCRKYGLPVRVVVQPVEAPPLDEAKPIVMQLASIGYRQPLLMAAWKSTGGVLDSALLSKSR